MRLHLPADGVHLSHGLANKHPETLPLLDTQVQLVVQPSEHRRLHHGRLALSYVADDIHDEPASPQDPDGQAGDKDDRDAPAICASGT